MTRSAGTSELSNQAAQPILEGTVQKDKAKFNRFGNRRGMNPNSRKNLSQPGHTNNPRGGPQISLLDLLRQELEQIPKAGLDGEDNIEHLNNAQLICKRYMTEVLDGNTTLLKDLVDRLHGKPVQALSGPDGGPIPIKQDVKIIAGSDIRPALAALIECGAVHVCKN